MKSALSLPSAALVLAMTAAAAPAQLPQPAQPRPGSPGDEVERPPVYRVELVVFRHAGGASNDRRSEEPADYTGLPDPIVVARASEIADRALNALAAAAPVDATTERSGDSAPFLRAATGDGDGEEIVRPVPPMFAARAGLSPEMARALGRLEDSPAFEPLVSRAWFQPAEPDRRTAPVRIHDETVVGRIEPEGAGRPLFFPDVLIPRFEIPAGPDGRIRPRMRLVPLFGAPRAPQNVYRLDGRARLRRSQFLHLELELVWQMPEQAQHFETAPAGWRLHRLAQSRVVQPGRLEYFDSALFGVLARVTRFEPVVPEIEAPPAPDEAGASGGGTTGEIPAGASPADRGGTLPPRFRAR
ncbi:MAG: CsiV family protein [Wenzhouxiangellaceae bacterium]|nr:CsiV family protein [Wenzhouxiangellaceae bacterium]